MVTVAERGSTNNRSLEFEFETLSVRYRQQLERAAVGLTGDRDDAADLVQETLIRAYRYFHNFEAGSNFRAWVLRILHNTHISRYRQQKRAQDALAWEEIAEHSESRLEDSELDTPAPEQSLLADLPDEEVQVALDSLPDAFRVVVELADLRDYSYAEIGQILRLPIGTVRSRLFRARQRLRGVLGEYAVKNGYVRPEELEEVMLSAA
ncbi:MAG: sigma-70 family RNA polymerase sigma factor [Armatimonadetes bacterium]|nr:sigma-70 family RNA polymerase sigma factor [Armatimonadota bacterium]